jgi:hypothetical protein
MMPHGIEALGDEDCWISADEDAVPYCLKDDVFGLVSMRDKRRNPFALFHGESDCIEIPCPGVPL